MNDIRRGIETPKGKEEKRQRQLREQGYADGDTGRRRRWPDPTYLASYRRGQETRTRRLAEGT